MGKSNCESAMAADVEMPGVNGDENGALPMVTIIIPCRNEAACIERTLESVLSQEYPPERMQILIVDGMSNDGTPELIRRVISKGKADPKGFGAGSIPCSVQLLENPQRTVPFAMNLGLKQAKGEVIFRMDGHSEMSPGYIKACVAKLKKRPDIACVGGPSIAIGDSPIGKTYALALRSFYGVGGRTFRTLRAEGYVDTVAFGGYPRRIFETVGGFDPQLERNQDIDFNKRISKAGFKQLVIPDVWTLYHAPGSLRKVVRQNYMNGFWNTKVLNKMLETLSWRHFIPLVFVLSILLLLAIAFVFSWALHLLIAILVVYAAGACIATVVAVFRERSMCAILLPLIFPTMHFSYGLGSMAGLACFLLSRRY
jgi:glycosyltransferase involved in cell wall biosynthesis